MSNAHLNIGSTLLSGKYRIEAILGQGGFGITYMAVHTILGKKVAIKEFFPKEYCDREESTSHITLGTQSNADFVTRLRKKFIKEAQNISKLNHKNIIQIQDVFEENNTAYYVMEYIEGGSLEEIVAAGGAIPSGDALRYMTAIADALNHMHAAHMIHLDVKPANIMIRKSDDCPILIDFGLSKGYGENGGQTSTTPHGVSHGYSPLEQYNADGVSKFAPQTDIYAFGATLLKLVSGETPPDATKRLELPLQFPEQMSESMRKFIDSCMALSKNARPADMTRVLDMLAACEATATPEQEATKVINQKTATGNTNTGKPAARKTPASGAGDKKKSGALKYVFIILGIVVAVVVALAVLGIFSGNDENKADEPSADTTAVVVPAESEHVITPAQEAESAQETVTETKTSDKAEPKKEDKKTETKTTAAQQSKDGRQEAVATTTSPQTQQSSVKSAAAAVSGGTMDAGLRVTGASVSGNTLVFNVSCDRNIYDADDCTASNPHFRNAINAYMGSSSSAANAARLAKQSGMSVRFNFNGARSFSVGY